MLPGGFGGMCTVVVGHPFDTIKVSWLAFTLLGGCISITTLLLAIFTFSWHHEYVMERQNIRYFGLICHLEYVIVQASKNVP